MSDEKKIIVNPSVGEVYLPQTIVPIQNLMVWMLDISQKGFLDKVVGFMPVFRDSLSASKFGTQVEKRNLVATKSFEKSMGNPMGNIQDLESELKKRKEQVKGKGRFKIIK